MTYLFGAYSLIWLGLLVYVFMISRKNRALEQQIDALEQALNMRGETSL